MIKTARTFAYTIVLLLLCISSQLTAAQIEARGELLWRVTTDSENAKTIIAVRYDSTWHELDRLSFKVNAQCANESGLHLFLEDGGYLVYSPTSGQRQYGLNRPAEYRNYKAVAACASVSTAPGSPVYLLLKGTAKTGENSGECILLKKDAKKWQLLTRLDSLKIADGDRTAIASLEDESIAVLNCTAEGWPKVLVGITDDKINYNDSLQWTLGEQTINSMISTGEDFLIFGSGPDSGFLRRLDMATAGISDPVELKSAEHKIDLSFASGADASMRGRLMLEMIFPVSGNADQPLQWFIGSASISNGQVSALESLEISGDNTAPQKRGQQMQMTFFLVLLALVSVTLMSNSKRLMQGKFTLPGMIQPAGMLKRLIAAVIELTGPALIAHMFFDIEQSKLEAFLHNPQNSSPEVVLMSITAMCIYLSYCIITETIFGATPIKLALGMQVCGRNCTKPTFSAIVIRNLMKPLELGSPLLLVFALWPVFTRYSQRAGDMIAGVTVINRPVNIIPMARSVQNPEDIESGQQTDEDSTDKHDDDGNSSDDDNR